MTCRNYRRSRRHTNGSSTIIKPKLKIERDRMTSQALIDWKRGATSWSAEFSFSCLDSSRRKLIPDFRELSQRELPIPTGRNAVAGIAHLSAGTGFPSKQSSLWFSTAARRLLARSDKPMKREITVRTAAPRTRLAQSILWPQTCTGGNPSFELETPGLVEVRLTSNPSGGTTDMEPGQRRPLRSAPSGSHIASQVPAWIGNSCRRCWQ